MSSTAQAPSHPKQRKLEKASASTIVNVMVIVDSDAITAVYPKNPNASKDNPTGLNHHEGITMLCNIENYVGNINNDPANLEFKANVGDWVSFHAMTVSGNSESAVILYDVSSLNGVNVFNAFHATMETRTGAVLPNPGSQDGLPPTVQPVTFFSYDSKVANQGKEQLKMKIALYTLDDTGENQVLYDYFWWDPQIDVQ